MLSIPDIRDLLVMMLTGHVAGETQDWHDAIGNVELVPLATSPDCNWKVSPSGTPEQVAAVEHAVAVLRRDHPLAWR